VVPSREVRPARLTALAAQLRRETRPAGSEVCPRASPHRGETLLSPFGSGAAEVGIVPNVIPRPSNGVSECAAPRGSGLYELVSRSGATAASLIRRTKLMTFAVATYIRLLGIQF